MLEKSPIPRSNFVKLISKRYYSTSDGKVPIKDMILSEKIQRLGCVDLPGLLQTLIHRSRAPRFAKRVFFHTKCSSAIVTFPLS